MDRTYPQSWRRMRSIIRDLMKTYLLMTEDICEARTSFHLAIGQVRHPSGSIPLGMRPGKSGSDQPYAYQVLESQGLAYGACTHQFQ